MARIGINPSINALSTIMFVCIVTLLIISNARTWKIQQKPNRGARARRV